MAALVSLAGNGRATFSALPSPFCPWEEKERRKEEREKRRGKKEKWGRTRRGKQAETDTGQGRRREAALNC